ncbi:hypothetical protein [Aliidiomarina celeris]|uniref:hypothetical protein n=1 Tax=Aliidiomarina celeris TaxID=2249428 RepID=UPI000DEB03F9|nr:hypothetical protein [Aliidiomarina celeris]
MAAVARHTVEAAQVAGDAQNAAELMQRGEQQTTVSVEQARRAGEALKSINTIVQKLNDMNAQIATAAEQQSVVAEEISGNFTGITDKATIAAAGSRQVGASSKELQQLAASLQKRVRKFTIAP